MLKFQVKSAVQSLSLVFLVAAGSDRCSAQSNNGDASSQQASATNEQTAAIVNELAATEYECQNRDISGCGERPAFPAPSSHEGHCR